MDLSYWWDPIVPALKGAEYEGTLHADQTKVLGPVVSPRVPRTRALLVRDLQSSRLHEATLGETVISTRGLDDMKHRDWWERDDHTQ